VAKTREDGLLEIINMEQIKSGGTDQHSAAKDQNLAALEALKLAESSQLIVLAKDGTIRTGSDITSRFKFENTESIKTSTYGPSGKGFDKSIGLNAKELKDLAQKIHAGHKK
jgi:hypothetical protein